MDNGERRENLSKIHGSKSFTLLDKIFKCDTLESLLNYVSFVPYLPYLPWFLRSLITRLKRPYLLLVRFTHSRYIIIVIIIIIIIIIIFISSWYKLVQSTNKNQPSSRNNYSSYATLRTKKM